MIKKINKIIKNNKLLLAIILIGLFFRSYKAVELFMYSHDHDLLSWFIKDVVVNHDLRLVGQETSVQGVYIGPLFYYLLIPFYIFFGMDPIGGLLLAIAIGLISIWSFYFVFYKVFNKATGYIGAFIYAVSFYTVLTDRGVVPTTPAMLWTIWFFYCLHLILIKKQKYAFPFLGILIGLIWHINLGLVIPVPLIFVALFLSKEKINIKYFIHGIVAGFISMLPFLIFEFRNNFQQISTIISSTAEGGGGLAEKIDKFDRVMQLVRTTVAGLMWGTSFPVSSKYALYLLLTLLIIITIKKLINIKIAILLWLWIILHITFFSLNSLILSEYYLNGMTVVWIAILSIFLANLLKTKKYRNIGIILLILFFIINLNRLLSININRSGYIDRRAIISYIKLDSKKHNYPCVSVSYITKPGNNLGYRYLFWLEDMHVNNPSSMSPVYTIVFPHSMVDRIDESFGALGLVLPDYGKYNKEDVEESCSGENSNLTDPLFGFSD